MKISRLFWKWLYKFEDQQIKLKKYVDKLI